ncbi:MAG: 4Fe-4S dicluster domain-containing protein [Candidatus Omnitrophica bacterium]|nr:4Fe-4S dicluster domain-containing protein [Candidatus Omnitrophota bacterium]
MGKKRKIKVYSEKCKGCGLCVQVCPAGVLEISGEINRKGMPVVKVRDIEKCTGCGLCFIMCPDCALEIVEEE